MFENYTGMNTGTRFIGFVLMGNEFVQRGRPRTFGITLSIHID